MGMTEWEFLHTTPKAFYNKLQGFQKQQDLINRRSWEQTRFIALQIINTAGKSVTKELKPKELILFDWEKIETLSLSKEEIENSRERFEYLKNKWGNRE